ncbi:hypothetical protein Tco_0658680 [Tanacetum coccineum]
MFEHTFFLGIQVKHKEAGNLISQSKYVAEILQKLAFATLYDMLSMPDIMFALIVLVLDRDILEQILRQEIHNMRLSLQVGRLSLLGKAKSRPMEATSNYRNKSNVAAGKLPWARYVESKSNATVIYSSRTHTDRPIVSTDGSKISTDEQVEGTDEHIEGTEEHNESTEEQREGTEEKVESTDGQRKGTEDQTEEEIAAQQTQTPTQTHTSTVFGDDETIAKVLLNMSQAKAVSREKEKGVELKDIEEADRPRPTSKRSLLTLKPLPKIDPKDKGKKKIEEEDESESESDGIPQAEKKFKQLESDEELARKMQEEWEEEEERNKIAEEKAANEALIRNFDDIKARIEADRLLAEKLQEQEREQFTIEKKGKVLHDT